MYTLVVLYKLHSEVWVLQFLRPNMLIETLITKLIKKNYKNNNLHYTEK